MVYIFLRRSFIEFMEMRFLFENAQISKAKHNIKSFLERINHLRNGKWQMANFNRQSDTIQIPKEYLEMGKIFGSAVHKIHGNINISIESVSYMALASKNVLSYFIRFDCLRKAHLNQETRTINNKQYK